MATILAWREQIAEVGDVDSRTRATLSAAFRGRSDGGDAASGGGGRDSNRGSPGAARSSGLATVRIGAVLVREHRGVLHRVTAVADGYEWNGQTFRSLSAAARAITGVSWNGKRFFGLDRGPRSGVVQSPPRSLPGRSKRPDSPAGDARAPSRASGGRSLPEGPPT